MMNLPAHGVLLELNGTGIYLTGDSGIGKSEIALQLIHQGARLICDDAPELSADTKSGQLLGSCPEGFYGLMHVHDLGVINIIQLFNPDSFKACQQIDLVIKLTAADNRLAVINEQTPQQLLTPDYRYWHYHSRTIPGICLHLYPNRDIPLLIKTAVMLFSSDNRMTIDHQKNLTSGETKK